MVAQTSIKGFCRSQTNKIRFQLPEIHELRNDFKGMNDFMFSKAYSDLLYRVLTDLYGNSVPNCARFVDNILVCSSSLCLMANVGCITRYSVRTYNPSILFSLTI
ncbi:hypothetical protein RF11_10251 [Thelohanellus kitauei]|uniref:Uncharacterized protein n=1 Tax=Thelohanellus kitauei TaxID=669202 RepID=A0A0C2JRY0_THEKT|nr:hypothetical protein RF11_10251 [Thelohanellus kitauei]